MALKGLETIALRIMYTTCTLAKVLDCLGFMKMYDFLVSIK